MHDHVQAYSVRKQCPGSCFRRFYTTHIVPVRALSVTGASGPSGSVLHGSVLAKKVSEPAQNYDAFSLNGRDGRNGGNAENPTSFDRAAALLPATSVCSAGDVHTPRGLACEEPVRP